MTTWTDDQRDGWKRPKVKQPDGSEKAYTRVTTEIRALDDASGLIPWKAGLVALGLVESEELRRKVALARDNIKEVRRIAEEAAERAGASSAATRGSDLHRMTEDVDNGIEPFGASEVDLADIAAYKRATSGWQHLFVEQAVVHDGYQLGGTPDRISIVPGYGDEPMIVDLKTGPSDDDRVGYHGLTWSAQLAAYAHSDIYDPRTGERSRNPARLDKGLIVWLPAGQGRVRVFEVDLVAGLKALSLAVEVRKARKTAKSLLSDGPLPLPDDIASLRALWQSADADERKRIEAKVTMLKAAG